MTEHLRPLVPKTIRVLAEKPPTMDGKSEEYDVFISYSSKDSDWVRSWLLPTLEDAGLRVCIDFRDFDIGVPSLINMERAVENSRATLLVLTENWIRSEWTVFESLMVQTSDPAGLRRRILPLMLRKCKLPRRLSILTYADFTDKAKHPAEVRRLVEQIMK